MRLLFLLCLSILISSCNNTSGTKKADTSEQHSERDPNNKPEQVELKKYQNKEWEFILEYPKDYHLLEADLPGDSPVINLYPDSIASKPPFAIHEKPGIPYMAILPKGFGVDGPSGKRKNLKDHKLPVTPNVSLNEEESMVYLLESGEPWAYFLRFQDVPANWTEYGGIFIHFSVSDFSAECISITGKTKSMEQCDPLGKDKVIYSGLINREARTSLLTILGSFNFKTDFKISISDLIEVDSPLPNQEIQFPFRLSGKARGYWFFEGDAPVEILNKNMEKIGETFIKAKGDWMTRDFVAFEGEVDLDAPSGEKGFLVFKRANPSGKNENDRSYKIPVIFPSK